MSQLAPVAFVLPLINTCRCDAAKVRGNADGGALLGRAADVPPRPIDEAREPFVKPDLASQIGKTPVGSKPRRYP